MPYIDRRTGEIVMRIVYDGAPEAGKTTNIYKLCELVALQRRGELKSPGTEGRRTEYFDWLDFAGGYVDGRKVRCQIVSVPGQSQLLHRRRYLLNAADAVVFVADSRPDHIAPNLDSLATTLRILEDLSEHGAVGIGLQANKQDLEGALAPSKLAEAFQLPASAFVLGARAHMGEGVMQSFIMAVRLATDRIRSLALRGLLSEGEWVEQENPEALYAAKLKREPVTAAPRPQSMDVGHDLRASDEAATLLRVPRAAGRVNPAVREALELPRAAELGAGHVWPTASGRALLSAACIEDCSAPEHLSPWAEADSVELLTSVQCTLHSRAGWVFAAEHEARLALVSLVRTHLRVAQLLPEGRVLFMAKSGIGFRVWTITPKLLSLRDLLEHAVIDQDIPLLAEVLLGAVRVSTVAGALAEGDRILLAPDLECFGRAPSGQWGLLAQPEAREPKIESPLLMVLLAPLIAAAGEAPAFARFLKQAVASLPAVAAAELSFLEERWKA